MKGSKQQRGTTLDGVPRWRLRVIIGRDTTGKRMVETETFVGTARAADTRLAELVADVNQGRRGGGAARTFADAVEHWSATVAPQLSPTTVKNYQANLARHVAPAFGARRLSSITPEMVERLYAKLDRDGLSARTVHQVHSAVSGIFTMAVRLRWLAHNPAKGTRRPRLKWRPPTAPPASKLPALLAAIGEHEEFRTLVLLAVASGARRGELVALRWSDIDLEAGKVRIARSIAHGASDGALIEKSTKTHAERTVAVAEYALDALRTQHTRAAERALAHGVALPRDAFVFSDDPAGRRPWRPDYVTTRFVAARNAAKLPDVRFHDLRHLAATLALASGAAPHDVRDRLGHRDLTTTGLYVHGSDDADRAIAERDDAAMREVLGL